MLDALRRKMYVMHKSYRDRRYAMNSGKKIPYQFDEGEKERLITDVESAKQQVLDIWFTKRASWTVKRAQSFYLRYHLFRRFNFLALYVCKSILDPSQSLLICLDGQGKLLWCEKGRLRGEVSLSNQSPSVLHDLAAELRLLYREGLATV